jgi:hypothetical protein
MSGCSRRDFIGAAVSIAALGVVGSAMPADADVAPKITAGTDESVTLRWLEKPPGMAPGVTGTVPWPRGALSASSSLRVTTDQGAATPAQSWPIAYWPDGSIKWTAHAILPGTTTVSRFTVSAGDQHGPAHPVVVSQTPTAVEVDTGEILCQIPRGGQSFIQSIVRDGRQILAGGRLICLRQDAPEPEAGGTCARESFISAIEKVTVEQAGPVRAVIKIEGSHHNEANRSWLPFVVRLYFYSGSDEIRIVHSFIFDGDEKKDFIRGIGVQFSIPMRDPLQDRHVRFVGEGHGLFAEAVRPITGLRRDPGAVQRQAQIDGTSTGNPSHWAKVGDRLNFIPAWGDFTLSQLCADGFQIRKRTRSGFGWIPAASGTRSGGVGYVGGVSGGLAFGIRDFWQKHPAQIDIRNAHAEQSQLTLWLWAPDAPAMDMRFYHDGLGQDTYPEQQEGLDTTYEDYEPGYGSPHGIARTSELVIRALPATPSRQEIVAFADAVRLPPVLVCDPQRYLDAEVFGALWTLPDRSSPAKALIEDQLAFYLDQYIKEVDQRSWYGFWDYGDVRHTYDEDRHVWRYDIGGFAWDNSELSTDLWLWYSFLRTGRADVFRMAEAMTRHTGEVDVYHAGPHKGLGTRHGVQHWGDSSKQTRISSAIYRRPYYFITSDERVGDLLKAQLTEGDTWLTNDVTRKLGGPPLEAATRATARWGAMTWGELAAAWLTEVERTRDPAVLAKLINSMRSISEMPLGFFTKDATMNLDTGVVTAKDASIEFEHLTAVFGLPEICAELARTYNNDVPRFADTWANYGILYNAPEAERTKALGVRLKSRGLTDAHSRCTAFAAWHRGDPLLAERAWHEWTGTQSMQQRKAALSVRHLAGPDVLAPIDEAQMSTNSVSTVSLAAIQNLALAGGGINLTPNALTGRHNG